ncbi:MAG: DNA cytosine methyltransferase [Paludibacter sp.]|nr:DNA cytosine methyltransferase [Paludibacter sp.]
MTKDIELIYIDLFSGAGGTSTGVETSGVAKVIACVNHDANAIASHAANHPEALHFVEDVRTLDVTKIIAHTKFMKRQHPDAKLVLWASLECTNFSKAKGGLPRDADSRTLAYSLYKHYDPIRNKYLDGIGYIQALDPDYIQIENVEEFMSWGEMDANGKPISRQNGINYMRFVNDICNLGYHTDFRILNSADFGAYTSRKRLFLQFAKCNLAITWPEPTHCKGGSVGMFDEFKKWKPVKDVLDFSDEGVSIFERKKPLSDKTLERIYAGLIKFVAGGKNKFISKYFSGHPESKNISVEQPSGAITTKDHHSIVTCRFISAYYSNGDNVSSIEYPSPTVTTKDRLTIVNTKFLDMQYGNGMPSNLNNPAPTVTTNPKHHLVTVTPWIMNTNYGNIGSGINVPAPTITANRKWHYLLNPQYMNAGGSVDNPAFTLIARMDKMPPYLVNAESGEVAIMIHESDTIQMIKIKEFMCMYGIVDIKMRMLKIPELKMIMGFPENYKLIGTQAEQKKYIGNAVEVTMARALCGATARGLRNVCRNAI